jgi:hypothetical protein
MRQSGTHFIETIVSVGDALIVPAAVTENAITSPAAKCTLPPLTDEPRDVATRLLMVSAGVSTSLETVHSEYV